MDSKLVVVALLQFLYVVSGRETVERASSRVRRDTVAEEHRKWPYGIVPYVFGYAAGKDEKRVFQEAVAELEKVSCVRFLKRTVEQDFVRIISDPDGCYSTIGRDGGRQDLSLGYGCHSKGIALHELLHTLGFFHEHTRLDRDHYIDVKTNNAIKGAQRQFTKYKPGEAETHDEPYDADSIMHYSNRAFSKNGRNTIIFRLDPKKKLGQRTRLSKIDIRQLNKLYRCDQSNVKQKNETSSKQKLKPTSNIDTCRDNPWMGFQCLIKRLTGGCYFEAERMSKLCPKTCGFCQPTCFDISRSCAFSAFYVYCQCSAIFRQRCRKTCRICKVI